MPRRWSVLDMLCLMLIIALAAFCVREHFKYYFDPRRPIKVVPARERD